MEVAATAIAGAVARASAPMSSKTLASSCATRWRRSNVMLTAGPFGEWDRAGPWPAVAGWGSAVTLARPPRRARIERFYTPIGRFEGIPGRRG